MASPEEILEEIVGVPGVEAAIAVDKDGLLLASAGIKEENGSGDMDSLGAVATGALGSAELVGDEFKKGALERVILEYEEGKVIVQQISNDVVLAIFGSKDAKLGILQLMIKRKNKDINESFSF